MTDAGKEVAKEKIKNHILDATVHSSGVITKSATKEEVAAERNDD